MNIQLTGFDNMIVLSDISGNKIGKVKSAKIGKSDLTIHALLLAVEDSKRDQIVPWSAVEALGEAVATIEPKNIQTDKEGYQDDVNVLSGYWRSAKVIDQRNREIGSIARIMIDSESGRINKLLIKGSDENYITVDASSITQLYDGEVRIAAGSKSNKPQKQRQFAGGSSKDRVREDMMKNLEALKKGIQALSSEGSAAGEPDRSKKDKRSGGNSEERKRKLSERVNV